MGVAAGSINDRPPDVLRADDQSPQHGAGSLNALQRFGGKVRLKEAQRTLTGHSGAVRIETLPLVTVEAVA